MNTGRRSAEFLPKYQLTALIGLLLLLFGALVIAGWLGHEPRIFRIFPGAATVINTALCFGLTGLALLTDRLASPRRPRIQLLLGVAIALIAGIVLGQYLFHYDSGIDFPVLHSWYFDDNPYPGRMSPPTAFAFVLCGATLAMMHDVRGLCRGLVVQALTTAVTVIGAIGIAGYLLHLPLAYDNYLFGQ